MQLELELQPSAGPSLLIAANPEAAWEEGASSWFARVASLSLSPDHRAAVVVPTRGQAEALKARLLAEGRSLFGVEFLTPAWLRASLPSDRDSYPSRAEDLNLLLAAAAENLDNDTLSPAAGLAALSVRRSPGHLRHLLEQLGACGTEFSAVDLPVFLPVVEQFQKYLRESRLNLQIAADRQALKAAAGSRPLFSHLLVLGFHGGHWSSWHLLQAAVRAAASATVLLQYPRLEAENLDAVWIGSWEEEFGEAHPAAAPPAPAVEKVPPLFLVGLDVREQADAIVGAIHHFLASDHCHRLGVLFPAAGALSRLVAASLNRLALPHYDAMGQLAPGPFEEPVFHSWLELQRTPRLHALLRFFTALPHEHPFFKDVSRQRLGDALSRALGDLAIDDLAMLTKAARDDDGKLAALLTRVVFLPERATLSDFLGETQRAFTQLGWEERRQGLEGHGAWAKRLRAPLSRTLFLRWLEEVAVSVRVTRDHSGAHSFARIHLLTPAQAEDQTWSHLILAGLNESIWPGSPAGDFLPAAQIESLNRDARTINRAATRRGRQGEGHLAVRKGGALYLGSAEQHQLARAQFTSLLENTHHGLAFTASVVQEEAPERISNPGEFLNRVYHEAHGRALSRQEMRALRETTRTWLQESALDLPAIMPATPEIRQTRVAYDARRTDGPAGEYDFALRTPPSAAGSFSVSETEELLRAPAQVWLRRYLGVEGEEDLTYAWNATAGKWTHDWLAALADERDTFLPFPSASEIGRRVAEAAERKRNEVRELCRQAGRPLPDWWESGWQGALCLALVLGRILGTAADWKWLVPEWRLEEQPIDLGDGSFLRLRGRADLLLARTPEQPKSLAVPELWIVDFKTGNRDSLERGLSRSEHRLEKVRRKVLKGDALQLALYAHAARQLGGEMIFVSLASARISALSPQLSLDDFADCQAAFRELARMQATGIFGFRGSLRSAYSFTREYPLAMLAVEPEIVEERWETTHPDLALGEENWS